MQAGAGTYRRWRRTTAGVIILAKEFTQFQISVPPFGPLDARRFLLQYRTNDTKFIPEEDNATHQRYFLRLLSDIYNVMGVSEYEYYLGFTDDTSENAHKS
jgi:hypothetical protein